MLISDPSPLPGQKALQITSAAATRAERVASPHALSGFCVWPEAAQSTGTGTGHTRSRATPKQISGWSLGLPPYRIGGSCHEQTPRIRGSRVTLQRASSAWLSFSSSLDHRSCTLAAWDHWQNAAYPPPLLIAAVFLSCVDNIARLFSRVLARWPWESLIRHQRYVLRNPPEVD